MKIWRKGNIEQIWQGGQEMAWVDYLLSLYVNGGWWLVSLCHRPSPYLRPPIAHLSSPTAHLPATISYHPSPTSAAHFPSATGHLPRATSHQPQATSHRPLPNAQCLPATSRRPPSNRLSKNRSVQRQVSVVSISLTKTLYAKHSTRHQQAS